MSAGGRITEEEGGVPHSKSAGGYIYKNFSFF